MQIALVALVEEKTLIATIFASGAMPVGPAATAAIDVPWPSQSIGSLSLSAMSVPPITFVLGKAAPPRPATM